MVYALTYLFLVLSVLPSLFTLKMTAPGVERQMAIQMFRSLFETRLCKFRSEREVTRIPFWAEKEHTYSNLPLENSRECGPKTAVYSILLWKTTGHREKWGALSTGITEHHNSGSSFSVNLTFTFVFEHVFQICITTWQNGCSTYFRNEKDG